MRTNSTPNITNVIVPASRTAVTYSEVIDASGYETCTINQQIGAFGGGTVTGTFYYATAATDLTNYQYLTAGDTWIPLRNGASDNVKIAHKFTTGAASTPTIYQVTFRLYQKGTLSSGDYIWCTLEGDSSGPDGSAIATSYKVDATDITTSTVGELVTFTFRESTVQALTAATAYHVVLQGDYTAGSTNQICMHVDTVASGGTIYLYDSGWTNVSTQTPPTTCLAVASWTAATDYNATAVTSDHVNVAAYDNQKIVVPTKQYGPYLQWYLAETSSWTGLLVSVNANLGDAKYAT